MTKKLLIYKEERLTPKSYKKIGILGGMGPQATADVYIKIIRIFQEKFNAKYDSDFPKIIINSIPLPDIVENKINERKIEKILVENSILLEKAGADFIIIPCNSVDKFVPLIRASVKIPILSIIEETVKTIKKDNVGLLATDYTISNRLYEDKINAIDKKVIFPSINEQKIITNIIMSILANKNIDFSKKKLKEIIFNLKEKGAEEIILGCTELPLISEKEEFLIDTIEVLAEKAVEIAKDFNMKKTYKKYDNQPSFGALALNTSGNYFSAKMKPLLILDLDGTLYDFDNGKTKNFKKSRVYKAVKSNACKFIAQKQRTSINEAQKIYKKVVIEFDGEVSIGLEKTFGIDRYEYFKAAFDLNPKDFITKKDLRPFIKGLKTDIAILTGAPKVWADVVLDYLNLTEYKEKLFTGESDIRKPNPKAFEQVCSSLKFAPANCISVGDQLKTDIIPAKSLGMKTILIKSNSSEADFCINSLEELPGALKRI